jgi:hypothetical protein
LFDIKGIKAEYVPQWLASYALFFASNFVLATALLKKHRVSSWILSIFIFVPYLAALGSTLVSVRPFRWRVTNARSKGLVIKLLAPHVLLIGAAVAIACLLATRHLAVHRALAQYYAWLVIDLLLAIPFMAQGYARSRGDGAGRPENEATTSRAPGESLTATCRPRG